MTTVVTVMFFVLHEFYNFYFSEVVWSLYCTDFIANNIMYIFVL